MDYIKVSKAAENGGLLCGACVCYALRARYPALSARAPFYDTRKRSEAARGPKVARRIA